MNVTQITTWKGTTARSAPSQAPHEQKPLDNRCTVPELIWE